ncbi:CHAT domain-containing protein [Sorangium sp. So ce1000]|uniref:CHAT domain-containing protein n=1 Tax=Sorangium sp. So ce1000 TaxID=3133325 RepID=UPI003F5E1972
MRVLLAVERRSTGWTVRIGRVRGPSSVEPLAERELPACDASTGRFPLPPSAEADAIATGEPHRDLCRGPGAAARLEELLAQIAARAPAVGTVVALGRYLFATLVGDTLWQAITGAALDDEPICLDLAIAAEDTDFAQLPWEMMRTPTLFLAGMPAPRIAVVRLVASAVTTPAPIERPLRVLFVVGSTLDDPEIRAGAEYLGLLRRLEARQMAIHSRILVAATVDDVEGAVKAFAPAVVHFVAHGDVDAASGRGYIVLRERAPGSRDAGKPKTCFGDALVSKLSPGGALPPVVLLSTCHSAEGARSPGATSLAAELVQKGVPLVVGMGGRVADQACRLFTRRFYEALIEGAPVDLATAHGRRAGFQGLADHEAMPDWAFPVLFAGDKVEPWLPRPAVCVADRIEAVARAFRADNNPPVLCDRIEAIGAYDELVAAHRAERDPWVLVLQVSDATAGERNGPQYGMTRLIEELAARAVYDGFLPSFVRSAPYPVPTTPLQVAEWILQAANDTRELFGEERLSGGQVSALRDIEEGGAAAGLDQAIRDARRSFAQRPGKIVAMALRRDLARLAAEGKRPPLVLLDAIHLWGDNATILADELLIPTGLGIAPRFPVILTCNTRITQAGHTRACEALTRFIERAHAHVRHVQLGPFAEPIARLAYHQYLLHREQPLVPSRGKEQKVADRLHKVVGGVPSRFRRDNGELMGTIDTLLEVAWLEVADDNAQLRKVR